MAGTSLLVLIDDIAAVLDDVALMTKVAAQKTAGLLGDDLAVNAEQVSGVRADRELPVVWAVAKGSLRNKLILVPTALAISAVANWLILPLLMLGGLYLCFEGFEKIAHKFLHSAEENLAHRKNLESHLSDRTVNMVEFERDKIKGAIRTDFILSAEIIVLTLGIVSTASFTTQVAVLSSIAILMTVGVYGMVAAIVKVDDAGLHLSLKHGSGAFTRFQRWVGAQLLALAPLLMKTLAVVGTAAMFLVGGGILVHGLHPVSVGVEHITSWFGALSMGGRFLQAIAPTVLQALFGIFAGGLALGGLSLWAHVRKK
jgi:predicted DNA repair protein MutK